MRAASKVFLIIAVCVSIPSIVFLIRTIKDETRIQYTTVNRLEERSANMLKEIDTKTYRLIQKKEVKEKRIENDRKYFKKYLKITQDIDRCVVSKTTDTNDYVIELIDSQGRSCSLWLQDDKVTAITPY